MKQLLWGMSFIVVAALSNKVSAQAWPESVVGNWSVIGNQSPGTLTIGTQAASGACRRITGTIYGNAMEGFYCPATGRIQFVRKDGNNDTIQAWSGNLSQSGPTTRIGGIFAALTPAGGAPGEYNFQASRP